MPSGSYAITASGMGSAITADKATIVTLSAETEYLIKTVTADCGKGGQRST